MSNWTIESTDFNAEKAADLGNQYFIGNGYLGVRGTLEEYGKNELTAINLAGIYDRHGTAWREPLNAPNALLTWVEINHKSYRLPTCTPCEHRQQLDFECALHSRKTVWETEYGTLGVTAQRFASMANPHLICMKYRISTDSCVDVILHTGIDCDIWDIHGPHYEKTEMGVNGETLTVLATAGETKAQVAVSELVLCDFHGNQSIHYEDKAILREIQFEADGKRSYTLYKFISIYTTHDGGNPLHDALVCSSLSAKTGYEKEKAVHIRRWSELWNATCVKIDGDDTAMQALNYSIYHLHCIVPRHAESMSIPARGLSGQMYKGAVFWDTEMFMLPFYLYTEPKAARLLLKYRIDTLPGARAKAKEYGYRGAFYAWESQEGGYDACSDYNVTDVFTQRPMKTYFRDKQVHISADIVYGIVQYLKVTGDMSLLDEGAAEVILECANFYRSMLVKRADSGCFEIHDVIGPDEYHERVNNNAYTNRMAKFVFHEAAKLIHKLFLGSSPLRIKLEEQFDLKGMLQKFEESEHRLYIPQPDHKTGIIEQFDGYYKLEDVSVDAVRGRLLDKREYWGGAYGVASHTQVIKQADIVAMLNLFSGEYNNRTLKNNWNFYEPRTEHGSSLSACMYAVLACRFGEPDLAYPFFMQSACVDLKGGGKQWAGLIYIGGTHPAACGGAWLTAIQGFAGLSVQSGVLKVQPRLPSKWKSMQFKIYFQGCIYSIEIKGKDYKISVENKKRGFPSRIIFF
ncbi:glycosyl hydrolase family 65 protein [Caproiciproducens galactitolivorans]|uniref:Glycoside hydrolase family 65 protein n=1 Tax=Caproiciproducens galactitolivorans TaxID=642589 RepID=A0ABT4BQS4_9FIRM|nr:glycosyl hydrolase family 65 protein [Caproiciproducens galactitolivorans]MCY1712690.1 glycoside hydrolase family 65 protein [Caproiciproducens galactitolivorans]